jgi:hypothetical protein
MRRLSSIASLLYVALSGGGVVTSGGGVHAFETPFPAAAAAAAASSSSSVRQGHRRILRQIRESSSLPCTVLYSVKDTASSRDRHGAHSAATTTTTAAAAAPNRHRRIARPVSMHAEFRRGGWAASLLGSCLIGGAFLVALPPEAMAASAAAVSPSPSVSDKSPFFRKADRPMLTSSLLEQYRIWDQDMADTLKYGGELERGDAANKGRVDAYPELLVPIVRMQNDLAHIQSLVSSTNGAVVGPDEWKQVQRIVTQPPYETKMFKTIFNAYGDNIYYSDPDRANLYLAGGATPKNEQSIAYLLRNDLLTAVQNVQVEVDYCLSHVDAARQENDVALYASQAADSLKHYLDLVPPRELDRARALLLEQQSQ